ITDPTLFDTDGDGIGDGIESGLETGTPDTDLAVFVADADPSTTTDPTSADTDGDGLDDSIEDANQDGAVDAGVAAACGSGSLPSCSSRVADTGCGVCTGLGCIDGVEAPTLPDVPPWSITTGDGGVSATGTSHDTFPASALASVPSPGARSLHTRQPNHAPTTTNSTTNTAGPSLERRPLPPRYTYVRPEDEARPVCEGSVIRCCPFARILRASGRSVSGH
ncbi:MAG: hypothetical protein AAF078_13245, partial [Planctomycetota bacterium]